MPRVSPFLKMGGLLITSILSSNSLFGLIDLSDDPTIINRDYNIKAGTLSLDLSGTVTGSWDSNVNRSDNESAFAIIPGLQIDALWELSPYVILETGVIIEYRSYTSGAGEDGVIIRGRDGESAATIDLEFLTGDDSIFTFSNSIQGNTDTISRVARIDGSRTNINDDYIIYNYEGSLDYSQRITPSTRLDLGYGYVKTWTASDLFKDINRIDQGFRAGLKTEVRDDLTAGVYASTNKFEYDDSIRNDGDGYSVGVSFENTLEGGAKFSGSVGGKYIEFDIQNELSATDDGGWFPEFDVSLAFQVGQFITHEIFAGSNVGGSTSSFVNLLDVNDITFANYTEVVSAGYQLNYLLAEGLETFASYEYQDASDSDAGFEYKMHIVEVGGRYGLSQNSSIFLSLQYQNRFDGNQAGLGFVRFIANSGVQIDF